MTVVSVHGGGGGKGIGDGGFVGLNYCSSHYSLDSVSFQLCNLDDLLKVSR